MVKTLILYVTTHGATADCARRLASALGGDAEVCEMKRFFDDVSRYGCVIVGAPVYGGRVPKTIREWCSENLGALCGRPFAVFFSCLSESGQTVQEYLRRNFPRELSGRAFACDSFGGAFYFTRLNAMERAIDRGLAASYANMNGIPAPDGKSVFVTISDRKIAAFAEKVKKIGVKSE